MRCNSRSACAGTKVATAVVVEPEKPSEQLSIDWQADETPAPARTSPVQAPSVAVVKAEQPRTARSPFIGVATVGAIVGGVATLWGGVIGAVVLTLLQEVLAAYTPHWEFWTGWVLLAVVLFARRGLAGLLQRRGHAP